MYLHGDLYHLNYHVEELSLKLILCLYQFYCYMQLLQYFSQWFQGLDRSQIVCSYMDDKAIRVTFQWRFDSCHHIFSCRSAEMLQLFLCYQIIPSIYIFDHRITHYSCNELVFFTLLFLAVMSEVYFFFS